MTTPTAAAVEWRLLELEDSCVLQRAELEKRPPWRSPEDRCSDSTDDVAGISGNPLWLRPSNIQTKIRSIQWKKTQLGSPGNSYERLIRYTCDHKKPPEFSNGFSKTYDFNASDFALGIKSAKLQDSGHYEMEITNHSGKICNRVEKPHLQGQWKAWADGMCQLFLDCLVPKDDNVSYALYRGSKLISEQRNFTYLENQTEASSLHTYTCNVSNKVSWESDTLNITQGCQSVPQKFGFLPLVLIIVILVMLLLGAVTYFCVWDKKRKKSQSGAKEFSTIYDYVTDPHSRRTQVGHSRASGSPSAVQENGRGQRELDRCHLEEQMLEQKSSGDGGTIYSLVQYKPSDSTSQEKCTLYSVIQTSRKSGSKKRNQNPSSNCTVYEEVGQQYLKARNPARLSRRELENFDVYS
ncbi:natural killer cell receptor 2B4 isoform X2 [Mesocricetus auratus]|uniref:Natural killer cell receptor 2B4 isoform X2 n=1 Tax=Mesocricetus auratus TaxID=10036 RepID=A0A1U8CFI1_MESAU|nr:natural killer cell receptor 2B4 isoform X2 [Mesocricetus auratus]